ncbi:unnamed protein product [Blepharisma stoltei]|uniref:Uncharacterized protein n=1 Tax=Blepharisma stoltei TaxID=1481888 RepID=A0AAU9JAG3_9CILI|nr:unnamed protein product [Blepharisma stoltei]
MSSKPSKFPKDIEKIILDTFDGGPVKFEPVVQAISPILASETNQFVLDNEGKSKAPNWSSYSTCTEFFGVVRNSIRSAIETYGFIHTSIAYKIPIELCIHIFYDTKVHIESEREIQKYKKYVESCLPKEPSIFTPKFCCNLAHQLIHGALNKQHIITTYGVEEESIELWLRLFSYPKKPRPLYDTFPKTFKIQLVRDYLEGNYDAENIKICWDLEKEVIENWIYAELEEKEEIVMPTARRRLTRGEKEDIVDKYLQKKMTYKEIKTKYGVNQSEVDKWITARRNGAKLRDPYHGHRASTIMDQAYKFLEFSS